MQEKAISRRKFLMSTGAVALGTGTLSTINAAESKNNAAGSKAKHPTLLFCCDLNWAMTPRSRPSLPADWAQVDPQKYFDWHRNFGVNVMFCQAYCSAGYALYPSKLGPVGKGNAATLFPRLYELSRDAGMPVWSYFTVGADLLMAKEHPEWIVPGTQRKLGHGGFFGPETPRTEMLCARIREFLKQYPVDWLLLDWFVYGMLKPNGLPVQPAEFVKKPFARIIGRPMPAKAEEITAQENLKYKRTVLAEQFQAIKAAVKETSPKTKIIFNMPYRQVGEALWKDHPVMEESDGLFAESSNHIVDWLLKVRKPNQRVMTTIIGRSPSTTNPNTWKEWHAKGCDFFGYAWGTPPNFEPAPSYKKDLAVVREAFRVMSSGR